MPYIITAVITLLVALPLGIFVGIAYRRRIAEAEIGSAEEQAKKILEDGKNLIIFPEGKRSYSGRLGDYKKLAFKLSKETGAKIVCSGFYYDRIIYGKSGNSFCPFENNIVVFKTFGILDPRDFDDSQSMAFAAYQKTFRGLSEIKRNLSQEKS